MHEFELLQSIYKKASQSSAIQIGPGDDMGELQIGNERVLCAVDQLIVGRHVTPETPPELIGRKAIARCFSDIAAMGATPVGSLLTACLPPEVTSSWCNEVFLGAKEVAERWGGPIFGGDIATSDGQTVFTVTAIASPGCKTLLRTGAQVDDYLCVTGELGNSIAGHHLSFTPRIKEAQELVQILGDDLHSMIDISDGLGQDAYHLTMDNVQIVIDPELLPLRDGATIHGAINDGEDYELLFTSAIEPPKHLATVIGRVQRGEMSVVTTDGKDISNCGWVHE